MLKMRLSRKWLAFKINARKKIRAALIEMNYWADMHYFRFDVLCMFCGLLMALLGLGIAELLCALL